MENRPYDSSFPVTQWTTLIRPIQTGSPDALAALNRLCEIYRPPVLQYFCRRGVERNEAEDLTQDFFASLLRNEIWQDIDRSRGLFRCFLATRLRWCFLNHCNRRKTPTETLEVLEEVREDDSNNPDDAFDSAWAWSLVRAVLRQLESNWKQKGRPIPFGDLVGFLTTEGEEPSIAALAEKHRITPNALYQSIFRLRKEYAGLVTESVALTVGSQEEVKSEIAFLMERLR